MFERVGGVLVWGWWRIGCDKNKWTSDKYEWCQKQAEGE